MTGTPDDLKSATLQICHVAGHDRHAVDQCSNAVAAISASRSGRGLGTCGPAQRRDRKSDWQQAVGKNVQHTDVQP